ncbi:hypothetical protein OPKNFCMD_4306 [Methylobacterium crusticola]|uniref:Uncharacterized protein n=1 Tax=Methylobacterium crusticola TaxID=1697972 RepID=A0ABQ4R2P8_9HYPH|nr:hypothetical protein [Methylobacterium crusticola]GJD51551.1 hypothetical protein OPKNFCMD_4306 [Methylobacterium crusticola]
MAIVLPTAHHRIVEVEIESTRAEALLTRVRQMFDRVELRQGEHWSFQVLVKGQRTVLFFRMCRADFADLLRKAIPLLARPADLPARG